MNEEPQKNKVKEMGKEVAKKLAKKVALALLKNPYFWAFIGIVLLAFVIIGILLFFMSFFATIFGGENAFSGDNQYDSSFVYNFDGYCMEKLAWPVPQLNGFSYITSEFADTSIPQHKSGHKGIDISNGTGGIDIVAVSDGKVVKAGASNGFGRAVFIQHDGYETRYGHIQNITVKPGQEIKRGEKIAEIGAGIVGDSTGPHLHFEVLIGGNWTNPRQWFLDNCGNGDIPMGKLTFFVPKNKQEFFNTLKEGAILSWKTQGVLPSLTMAQAALESSWGNSGLTKKANNLFGIKGKGTAGSVVMMTTEYRFGIPRKEPAAFRAYYNWAESVHDHGGLFIRMKRYRNLICTDNYVNATYNVWKDGYATDPKYTGKLQGIIQAYSLDAIDAEAKSSFSVEQCQSEIRSKLQ